MVEISMSGSGEGSGWVTAPSYSTDATIQRFASRDAIRTMRSYTYCYNDPTTYIDPSGLTCVPNLAGDPKLNLTEEQIIQDYNQAVSMLTGQAKATYNAVNSQPLTPLSINMGPGMATPMTFPGATASTNFTKDIGGNIDIDLSLEVAAATQLGVPLSTVLAGTLYHELVHVQQDIDTPLMSLADKEFNAYKAEAAYDTSIGYGNSFVNQILRSYTDYFGNHYTGDEALRHYIDDFYVHPERGQEMMRRQKQSDTGCPC